MSYKTILVHLDNGKRAATRLDIAIVLARKFEAHVVGLHALTAVPIPSYVLSEGGPSIAMQQQKNAQEQAARAEGQFRAAVDKAALSGAEWRRSAGDALDACTLHARYADLVVIGQADSSDNPGVEPEFPEQFVLSAGRPVLVVPYAGKFPTVGERVLISWNAGREATRAVTDAIPLLRLAKAVDVIAFNPDGDPHGEVPGADIGLYLARHGVKVKVAHHRADDVDVGNQILSRAADLGTDLIVMGAWGHSRVRELILGGVTRTLLETMTVPVLMSH